MTPFTECWETEAKLFRWFSLSESKFGKNEDFTGVYRTDRDQHFAKPIHEMIGLRDRICIVNWLLKTDEYPFKIGEVPVADTGK